MVHFMAYKATHGGARDGPDSAAAGKNRAADRASTRSDRSISVLLGHISTSTQAEQHDSCEDTDAVSPGGMKLCGVFHNGSLE
jgi:hypothetical protein